MRKILLGGAFIIGGYFIIKKLMAKDIELKKAELEYVPYEHEWDLEAREKLYEHLKIVQSNAENNTHHLSRIDIEKAFTPEVVEKFKETDIYKQLSKFKPYQIDTTAIENLGKNEGQIPSFGFSQEQLNALIENYRAGTPILPSYD